MTSGSLWNYYRDEANDDANENNNADNYRINKSRTTASKFFEYKIKIIKSTPENKIWVIIGDLLIHLWLTVKKSLIYHGQKIVYFLNYQ